MNNLVLVFHIKANNSESTLCQIEPWMVQYKDNILTYPDSKISDLNFDSFKDHFTTKQIKLIQLCKELSEKEIEKYFNKNTKKTLSLDKLLVDNRISLLIQQKTKRIISEFIKICIGESQYFCHQINRDDQTQKYKLELNYNPLQADLHFKRTELGVEYRLTLNDTNSEVNLYGQNLNIILNEPAWFYINQNIYTLHQLNANKLKPFVKNKNIFIPKNKVQEYFKIFIKEIASKTEIKTEGFDIQAIQINPILKLIFTRDFLSDRFVIIYEFQYGENSFTKNSKKEKKIILTFDKSGEPTFKSIQRDFQSEQKLVYELLKEGFIINDADNIEYKHCVEEFDTIHYFISVKDKLEPSKYQVIPAEIDGKVICLIASEIKTSYQKELDWFDIHASVKIGEIDVPFNKLLKNIKNNNPLYELENGEIFIIPKEWFAKFEHISKFAELDSDTVRINKSNFTIIDNLFHTKEENESAILSDEEFKFTTPNLMIASLREYQWQGAKWLCLHQQNGLGALLADDMGLGKTIQTLTAICHLKENLAITNPKPQTRTLFDDFEQNIYVKALIIMPTSLIFNWQNEILKFSPSLSIYIHTGNKRSKDYLYIEAQDIILTTYQTALIDISLLEQIEYNYIILDESHYIKNKDSKIFKALHQLRSKNRLSLSGTPIENSLSDLFSQMEFLNPNILGTYKFFKQQFQIPIEKKQDQESLTLLKSLVNPYILRRLKTDVLNDLPEMTEQIFYSEMTAAQRKLFEEQKSQARNQILNLNQEENQSKIMILNILMSLRKIANHPSLFDQENNNDSGKFNDVIHQIEPLIQAKHKILIFSNFTSHLDIYRKYFNEQNWKYSSLTGEDSPSKRIKEIDKFNSDNDCHLFLLSIKAGGVGLNLTAANYVFILDPWWNPFIENQAIARAYRIGQKQAITVIRFISKSSIEEKIQLLQAKKLKLVSHFTEIEDSILLQNENLKFIFE
jgi:SNF2 family DNA or RNA helicase